MVDKIFRDYDSKLLEVLSPLVKGKRASTKPSHKARQQGYLKARVDRTVLWQKRILTSTEKALISV